MLLLGIATDVSPPTIYTSASASASIARRPTILLEGFAPQEREKIAASLPAYNNISRALEEDKEGKEGKEEEEEEERNVGSRPRGGKAELRRPIATNTYYSSIKELQSISAQNGAKRKRQLLLSYIGRLEETTTSIDRAPIYSPCIKKGVPYKVYTRTASKQYIAYRTYSNNYIYTRYRFYGSQAFCLQQANTGI